MPLEAGTRLGHYEILALLGAGGMGEVYRARDPRLDRQVAIKVLPAASQGDPARERRFQQEARAAAALNHPNILAIHDVEVEHDPAYIVTELVEGHPLRDEIALGSMPPKRLLDLATQIADGLAAAHKAGVVHRDLKPENVMVTAESRVKILDFGLALRTHVDAEDAGRDHTTATMPGAVLGTAPYMSPEQARGQAADFRSDQFSLGCVLYEMATGRAAFRRETAAQTLAAVIVEEPEPVSALSPQLPAPLVWLIERCLAKDPGQRYGSTIDLHRELLALRDHLPQVSAARPSARPRRSLVFAGMAVVVAVALALALREWVRSSGSSAPAIESLAVLPLQNLSGDPEQEYFADGMTEALIADLARIRALHVVSRTSVLQYKGSKKALPEIARELKVDAVVEGSVLRSGDRVRITAQLIEAATDRHLWSQSYERSLSDILALQSEVAQSVAGEIRVAVTPQEQQRLKQARSVDAVAHEAYLRGRFFWNRRVGRDVATSIEYFQQAIERDPAHALAHVGLADAYAVLSGWEGDTLAPRDGFPKAKRAAGRAIELEPTLAEPHASLGFALLHYDWDWAGAESEFKKAIELNPNYAIAHHWYSHVLTALGRTKESLRESQRALELDPADWIINAHLAWHFQYARDYDRAIKSMRKGLELAPTPLFANYFLGLAYEQKGVHDQAIDHLQRAKGAGAATFALAALGHAYAMTGRRAEAQQVIRELEELAKLKYVPAFNYALVYTGLGDNARAFEWLDKAHEERSSWLAYLEVEPRLDPLRSDPRFTDLVRRVGLPASR